jgi:NAD(P)-dependent dehydrogenase (short-subunit alcohol dehydrogenase family)
LVTVFDTSPQPSDTRLREVEYVEIDVSSEMQVSSAFRSIVSRGFGLDYLVCCAAIFPSAEFAAVTSDTWQRTLAVNLTGSFICVREAVRHMRVNGFGRIVLFSSMMARTGGTHSPHYAASKGGVLGLARSVALETATENIRINTISPGLTDTTQPRGHLSEEDLIRRAAAIPLRRLGSPREMAEATLFLLGDESAFVTGQDLRVNGGAALW